MLTCHRELTNSGVDERRRFLSTYQSESSGASEHDANRVFTLDNAPATRLLVFPLRVSRRCSALRTPLLRVQPLQDNGRKVLIELIFPAIDGRKMLLVGSRSPDWRGMLRERPPWVESGSRLSARSGTERNSKLGTLATIIRCPKVFIEGSFLSAESS
jgi:hypothetical protein